ncbi:MAG: hypothetical protein ACREQZ_02945 [Woeseiaceae bacterium]
MPRAAGPGRRQAGPERGCRYYFFAAQRFFAAQGFLAAHGFVAAQGFLAAQGFFGAHEPAVAQGFFFAAAHGFLFLLAAHGFAAHGFFCASWTRVALRAEHGLAAASGAPSISPDESMPATTGRSLDFMTPSCK